VRWRTLLLIGVAIFAISLGIGIITWRLIDDRSALLTGDLAVAGVAAIALIAILGFLAGWFGREGDEIVLVAIGYGLAAALFFAIMSLVVGDWHIVVVLLGIVPAFVAAVIARVTWWVGDSICELRGLPNGARLVEPAYPEEFRGVRLWTTEAGPALRRTLDALADRVAPGARVDARAIGVLVGVPRDRPVAIVLAAGRLAFQQVGFDGVPTSEPFMVDTLRLAEVSIRSEAADGTLRKHINAYDDLIEVRTAEGARLRFRLPYGTRGAGATTGGPDEIRAWLRTNAMSYR
jgi:hypothetical protein